MKSGLLSLLLLLTILKVAFPQNLNSPPECGIPQVVGNELILNAQETAPGEWPWHVAIYHHRQDRSTEYVCGGSIISEQYVLTAAHCMMGNNSYPLSPSLIVVRVGIHNLKIGTRYMQEHEVFRIHTFENFTRFKDDIALIQLSTIIQFNDYVQPVCVDLEPSVSGEYGAAIGWGITEDDVTSDILRKVDMPVIDPYVCIGSAPIFLGKVMDNNMFCAGFTNGTAVCNGDSGGGMFFKRGNKWFLKGIVSFAGAQLGRKNFCNPKGYGVFTKVRSYLSWISKITQLNFMRGNDVRTCDATEPIPGKNYPNRLPRDCGVYITNRIAAGRKAGVFEFPWMARILSNNTEFRCLGTLINSRYILSVASCLTKTQP